MDVHSRTHSRAACLLASLAVCLAMTGCLGPTALRSTRMRYNEALRATNDEQLLTNLVRLRYADSPIFIDLPNITSQFELAGNATYNGGYGNQYRGPTSLGFGGLMARDSPTLSYHPRAGREVAKALLNPLSADLFSVVSAGARVDQLFWLCLNDINDVQNAVRATTLVPRVPDSNERFLRGVQLLAEIDDKGGAELGFSTEDETIDASDSIDESRVLGRDIVSAGKEGYAFRTKAPGQMVLYKRDKQLTLKIRSAFTHSKEMDELASIFHLTPGLSRYKIKSELQPDAESSPPGALGSSSDTIYLNLRSALQIMTFLSKGVCVPMEHIATGVVPTTPGPDGQPFDWATVTAGNFMIASSRHCPKDVEVKIKYRDYWFYIPREDVNSRSVLAILEIILSLQESDEKTSGPVLTLPAGS